MRRIKIILSLWLAVAPAWADGVSAPIAISPIGHQGAALQFPPQSGGGTHQVVLDACASADGFLSSGTSATFTNQTVGTGSNRALTVFINWGTAVPTGITVTWDSGGTNQAMTQLALQSQATLTTAIYGLVAPTSGNKTLSITWTNTAQMIVNSCAWTGVNQTGSVTSFPGAQTAIGAATVNVTSASTDFVVGTEVTGGTVTATTGTNVFIDNSRSVIAAAAQYQAGSATVTTGATTAMTAVAGVDIAAQ